MTDKIQKFDHRGAAAPTRSGPGFSELGYAQAWALAEEISARLSKSKLVPKELSGKPEDILITIMTGYELGLSPFQSLRGINVIKGRPAMSADLIAAQVMRTGEAEYFQPSKATAEECTYVTRRRGGGKEVSMSFTKEDAVKAGLWGNNGPWKQYPAAMLRARAASAIARAVYPEAAFGLYTPDELSHDEPAEKKPRAKRKKKAQESAPAEVVEPTPAEAAEAEIVEAEIVEDRWEAEVVSLHAELHDATREDALKLLPRLKVLPEKHRPGLRDAFNDAMQRQP
jgi:hypothetical protein